MRPSIVALALLLGSTPALAGEHGSGGGGGGRLGQVSAGINNAGGSSSSSSGGSSSSTPPPTYYGGSERYCDNSSSWGCRNELVPVETVVVGGAVGGAEGPQVNPAPRPRARFEGYAGAQKVFESDGSVSLELALVDPHFRLDATLTHYYESQMDGSRVTMTMPQLTVGVRFGDVPAWLEGGVVHVRTSDPMGDSSLIGPVIGTRLEHPLSRRVQLFGVGEAMYFKNDVKAYGGRVGVRVGPLQASFRYLDFNVGPALYGPELGFRF